MTNVPDRPQGLKMKDLEKALTDAGFDVGWTVNLHVTGGDGKSCIVETFDEAGDPYLYAESTGRDHVVAVGGDTGDPIDCVDVAEVLAALEVTLGR